MPTNEENIGFWKMVAMSIGIGIISGIVSSYINDTEIVRSLKKNRNKK